MIAAVAYDAGGAEIVSSHVRRNPGEWIFSLDGPARAIFERKLGPVPSLPLEEAVARGRSLLVGTGWQSDLEWRALDLARRSGKRSVAFLDHWANYVVRFERGGVVHLPDELWVGDRYAKSMAEGLFPRVPLRLVPNPYLAEIVSDIEAAAQGVPVRTAAEAQRVLFVSEPISAFTSRSGVSWGYDEFSALRFFVRNLHRVASSLEEITLRPHPADPPGKYDLVLREFQALPIRMSDRGPLALDIARADVVAGCETMAMVVALDAGRRVVSCVPDGGKPCALPHEGIVHLSRLLRSGSAEV